MVGAIINRVSCQKFSGCSSNKNVQSMACETQNRYISLWAGLMRTAINTATYIDECIFNKTSSKPAKMHTKKPKATLGRREAKRRVLISILIPKISHWLSIESQEFVDPFQRYLFQWMLFPFVVDQRQVCEKECNVSIAKSGAKFSI